MKPRLISNRPRRIVQNQMIQLALFYKRNPQLKPPAGEPEGFSTMATRISVFWPLLAVAVYWIVGWLLEGQSPKAMVLASRGTGFRFGSGLIRRSFSIIDLCDAEVVGIWHSRTTLPAK